MRRLIIYALLIGILAGCSVPVITREPLATETAIPATVTRVVITETATPTITIQITETRAAVTPTVTPTPRFDKWGYGDVMEVFNQAGVEFENPRRLHPEEFGLTPLDGVSGVWFHSPSQGTNFGGRLMFFSDPVELLQLVIYYEKLGDLNPEWVSWIFVKDNVMLQIPNSLPEALARKYEDALNHLR